MTGHEYPDEDILDMLRQCAEAHEICSPRVFNEMDDTCSASLVLRRFGSWIEAKKQAGIEEPETNRGGRSQKYSDEDILEHIRECYRRNDGKCTVQLLQSEDGLVAPSVAVERFGSWLEVKQKAGIETDERTSNHRPREYSNKEYLDILR